MSKKGTKSDESNLPVGPPTNNSGSDTLERYRYQNTYTAILAIKMHNGENNFERIICEYHEDVLGVHQNRQLVGIQIKTREMGEGGFRPLDPQMKNSLKHFVELECDFGKYFQSYVIVSNCGFKKGRDSFDNFMDKNNLYQNEYAKKLIDWIRQETKCSIPIIEKMFSKLILSTGPGIQNIEDSLIKELTKVKFKESIYHFQLQSISNNLVSNIFFRSSNKEKNLLEYLFSTLEGSAEKNSYIINEKTITKDSISKILVDYVRPPFIQIRQSIPHKTPKDSIEKMKIKLEFGGIDNLVINDIEDEVLAADKFVLRMYHSEENKELADAKIRQIHAIVKRNASQSFSRTKKENEQFGQNMLHELEDRLQNMTTNERRDVYDTPFDILRGVVGRLTGKCLVQFSKTPEGGF